MIPDYKLRTFELFNYHPHPGQIPIHESSAQLIFAACGVRFGKTKMAAMEGVTTYLDEPRVKCDDCKKVFRPELGRCPTCSSRDYLQFPDVRIWAVGPEYKYAKKVYSEIVNILRPQPVWKDCREDKAERILEMKDGSWIAQRSADKPQSLAAEELDLVILDEAARCKKDTFEFLCSRLLDREGRLFCIGTPIGRNWYHKEYLKGLDPNVKDRASFHFPTTMNPYISREQIEKLKSNLAERFWRQEVKAEFLEDASAVFTNVQGIVDPLIMKGARLPGQNVIGLDLAKFIDYTVAIALNCRTGKVIDYLRIQGNWLPQIEEIKAFGKKYEGAFFVDATMDDIICELLLAAGFAVYPQRIDRLFKEQMITRLQKVIEDQSIKIPDDELFISELEAFQFVRRGMNFYMEAPEGLHDDFVTALALAVYGYTKYGGPMEFYMG